MIPILQPPETYGQFNNGDSYIILFRVSLEFNVHFWIGSKAPQDSRATAAIRSVQLVSKLGGEVENHREAEGDESDVFHSYFDNPIVVKEGGCKSAFRKVDPADYTPRLLRVYSSKGEVKIRIINVPIQADSINQEDVFILDVGAKIYVWQARMSSRLKRGKALETAPKLKQENPGLQPQVIPIEEGEDPALEDEFWQRLCGGRPEKLQPTAPIEEEPPEVYLYKIMEVVSEGEEEEESTIEVITIDPPYSRSQLKQEVHSFWMLIQRFGSGLVGRVQTLREVQRKKLQPSF